MPVSSGASGIRPGTVAHFAAATAPAGWIKANGAAVSRTAYAGLFLAIGTTYGAGDGVTTFNVPDLRGEFLRGLDEGRGVDTGRAIGSAQASGIGSHSHTIPAIVGVGSAPPVTVAASNSAATGTASTNTAGGTETRPRNVALLACIKF